MVCTGLFWVLILDLLWICLDLHLGLFRPVYLFAVWVRCLFAACLVHSVGFVFVLFMRLLWVVWDDCVAICCRGVRLCIVVLCICWELFIVIVVL